MVKLNDAIIDSGSLYPTISRVRAISERGPVIASDKYWAYFEVVKQYEIVGRFERVFFFWWRFVPNESH